MTSTYWFSQSTLPDTSVTEYTVLPSRALQGVALEQFNPAVSTVGLVSTSPKSPSCDAIPAPIAPEDVTPPEPVSCNFPSAVRKIDADVERHRGYHILSGSTRAEGLPCRSTPHSDIRRPQAVVVPFTVTTSVW